MNVLAGFSDWFSRITRTIVLVPHLLAIGNRAEEIYFGLLKARRERKTLAVVLPYELPGPFRLGLTNIEVANLWSPYRALSPRNPLHIAARLAVTAYFVAVRVAGLVLRRLAGRNPDNAYDDPMVGLSTLWQPRPGLSEFSWSVVDSYRWREQLQEPLPVALYPRRRAVAERAREEMGLPRDAWFVCLHVRESGFHGDQVQTRNADIHTYVAAIQEITLRGGWVVRMGDRSMKRLPEMERVVDYPFTPWKSPVMDLYLLSQCRFFVGTPSGLYELAVLFQRPSILTNVYTWLFPYPQKSGDLSVLKHLYSRSRRRYLSLGEWLDEPFASHLFWGLGDDYVFEDNTPGELRAAVIEWLDRGTDWRPTPAQVRFSDLRCESGRRLLSRAEPIVPGHPLIDVHQRYRLASRVDSSVGFLSAAFVAANWERSSRERVGVGECTR